MDMALDMGAFVTLDQQELFIVDGGKVTFAGVFDSVCKAATSCAIGCIAASFVPAGPAAYLVAAVTAGVVVYLWENI